MVGDLFVLGPEVCIWFLLTSHWPAPGYLGIVSCQGDWGPYPNSNPRRKREGKTGLRTSQCIPTTHPPSLLFFWEMIYQVFILMCLETKQCMRQTCEFP